MLHFSLIISRILKSQNQILFVFPGSRTYAGNFRARAPLRRGALLAAMNAPAGGQGAHRVALRALPRPQAEALWRDAAVSAVWLGYKKFGKVTLSLFREYFTALCASVGR